MRKIPVLYDSEELCCGCTACVSICPVKAISMKEDKEGFDYPEIDDRLCIRCNKCKKVCPMK